MDKVKKKNKREREREPDEDRWPNYKKEKQGTQ
jgi:hypothetical protein